MAVSLPSVSATSGTLTASGVGSGIDVKGLVSQLMAVEQRPLTLLAQKEADFQAQLSSLGSVQGSLSSLQSAAQMLASAGTASYSASVSDGTFLSATTDSTAVSGSYSVDVTQLAQAQKLVSPVPGQASLSAAIGTGAATTVTVTLGTITGTPVKGQYASAGFAADPTKTPVTLTIDSSNNTLAGIRDAINAANAGVTASIINDGSATPYRLALTSNATGAVSSMQIAVSGDAAIGSLLGYDPTAASQNLDEIQTAQDAKLKVDGVGIISATNSVAGAIQGVTLNLTKAPTTSPVTVTVQRDTSKISSALNALVNAYNGANKTIAAATAKGATLQGDWAVLSLERQVRSLLGSVQNAGGTYTTLSQLGVSFQKDGSLLLDATKLGSALSSNVGDVSAFVAAMGNAVNSAANDMLGSTGAITNETAGINNSIKDIDSQRIDIQRQLDATQARYQAQFSALDTLLASMNSTSSFLTQQLSNLPNYYNKG
ncbi:MAG: flagellar filament capping protein FliD [Burkholderiales bacterium]|jgi:flagellar hook-associated protein 2